VKILQVSYSFPPNPPSGVQRYVEMLSQGLKQLGEEVVVAAPGRGMRQYQHEGLRVRRFPGSPQVSDLRHLNGEGDPEAADRLGHILEGERPDLVHLHAFNHLVSVRVLRRAKALKLPVLLTSHTPSLSCPRGTLMRWGRTPCDGTLSLDPCTACTLHGRGIPRGLADLLGRVPVQWGEALGRMGLSGKVWTGLRMRELISVRRNAFRALLSEGDHVVAISEWLRLLLIRNGLSGPKVTLCRHGTVYDDGVGSAAQQNPASDLKCAFVGRFHPTKGMRLLIQALRRKPKLSLTLDFYGIAQGALRQRRLKAMAAGNARITFHPPLQPSEVVDRLRDYDLLLVPSQVMETGPLVVLEAFAAGLPVVGSRLGGIAEMVQDGVNGLLLPHDSPRAWHEALRRLCQDPALLNTLRQGVRPPQGIEQVVRQMQALYRKLISY